MAGRRHHERWRNDRIGLRLGAANFAKHPTRLDYAGRLAEGRSIGSGAIEGAIKQNVNLQLKRTGAGWRVDSVGLLVELRALSHTPIRVVDTKDESLHH